MAVLSLLNSSETVDQIYPQLCQILKANFGCEALLFGLSQSADDTTLYIWDAETQRLDANMTLAHAILHPAFSAQQPSFIPEIDPASPYLIDNLLCDSQLRSYAIYPLSHDSRIGTLVFGWRTPYGYAAIDSDTLAIIVHAITVTLIRSRRVNELRDALRNTRALYATSHALISTDSLKTVLKSVVNNSAVAVGSSHCTLCVFDRGAPDIKHVATYHHPLLPPLPTPTYAQLMAGVAGWVVENRRSARLNKNQIDARETPQIQQRRAQQGIGAMIIAPVIYRQRILGILTALNTVTQPDFDDDALALLSSLANQAAVAIAKARLYAKRERQVKTLGTLRDFSRKMHAARSVQGLLSVIMQELKAIFQPAFMEINLIENEEAVLVSCMPEELFPLGQTLSLDRGITGAVAQGKEIVIIPDLQADPRAAIPAQAPAFLNSLKTTVGLPLLDDNKLVGVLLMAFQTVREFKNADQTLFQAITSVIGGALQHVILLESLEDRIEERTHQLIFANKELQAANAQLEELDALKNKFISDVSHELRTPLTSLGLYLDLLERRPDRQAHYLGVVRREVNRLRTLVLDVLKIARYDSKRVVVNFQVVCMTDVVMKEVALHRERAEAVGIEVEMHLDPNGKAILGDVAQLAEMMTVLLYNAINYTEKGKIEICLRYVAIAQAMELTITDSGMGIAPDEIPHVFRRFYRGSNASMQPGNGLGLNLAEQIVHLHNGYISLNSELGKGTSVCVLLPVLQNADVATEAKHPARMTISK